MHTYTNNSDDGHGLALGLFVMYNSFPWLIAELKGCAYYCQNLTVVTVSLVSTLFSRHWCLRVFQWNERCRRIVATQKRVASSCIVWSKKYGTSFSWKLFVTALCCHNIGTTERLHSWYWVCIYRESFTPNPSRLHYPNLFRCELRCHMRIHPTYIYFRVRH